MAEPVPAILGFLFGFLQLRIDEGIDTASRDLIFSGSKDDDRREDEKKSGGIARDA